MLLFILSVSHPLSNLKLFLYSVITPFWANEVFYLNIQVLKERD